MQQSNEPPRRRRTRLKPEVQRERILAAALSVFTSVGYARATMGHIADEAQITRPLLYHYFSSKQEIFDDLLVQTIDQFDVLMRRLREHQGPVREQIRLLVDGYHELMRAHPGMAALCVEAAGQPGTPRPTAYEKRIALLRFSLLDWIDGLGPEVRAGVDREQFLLIALSVLNFYFLPTPFGRALGAGPDTGMAATERHKAAVCDILLNGLLAKDRNPVSYSKRAHGCG